MQLYVIRILLQTHWKIHCERDFMLGICIMQLGIIVGTKLHFPRNGATFLWDEILKNNQVDI